MAAIVLANLAFDTREVGAGAARAWARPIAAVDAAVHPRFDLQTGVIIGAARFIRVGPDAAEPGVVVVDRWAAARTPRGAARALGGSRAEEESRSCARSPRRAPAGIPRHPDGLGVRSPRTATRLRSSRRSATRRSSQGPGDPVQGRPCPSAAGVGTALVRRDDDDPATVRRRLALSTTSSPSPVLGFYDDPGRLRRIDGVGHTAEIRRRLAAAITPAADHAGTTSGRRGGRTALEA